MPEIIPDLQSETALVPTSQLNVPAPVPPPPTLAEAIVARMDERLAGKKVRFIPEPIRAPGIKQVYRSEKSPIWPVPMDDAGLELAHKIADDLAEQIARWARPGTEVVSWEGELPRRIPDCDKAIGRSCAVRILRNYDIVGDRYTMRFDVIFCLKQVILPKR